MKTAEEQRRLLLALLSRLSSSIPHGMHAVEIQVSILLQS
jgi:hypothetical protein